MLSETPSKNRQSSFPATSEKQTPNQVIVSALQYYLYPRGKNKSDPLRERHYLMICVLMQLIALTILLFLSALAINYLVVATSQFGQIQYCLESEISLRDWYSFTCLQCETGYTLTASSALCQSI